MGLEIPEEMQMQHYVQQQLCKICGHEWQPLQEHPPWTERMCYAPHSIRRNPDTGEEREQFACPYCGTLTQKQRIEKKENGWTCDYCGGEGTIKDLYLNQSCLPAPIQEIINDFFYYDVEWTFGKAKEIAYMKGYRDCKHKRFILFGKPKYDDAPNLDMAKLQYPERFVFPNDKLLRWWPDCPGDKKKEIEQLYFYALEANYQRGFRNSYQLGWLDSLDGFEPYKRKAIG